jgi:hypothetical protein
MFTLNKLNNKKGLAALLDFPQPIKICFFVLYIPDKRHLFRFFQLPL